MKFFTLSLLLATYSLSVSSSEPINDDKSNYKDAIEKLANVDPPTLSKIEKRLDMRKDEIVAILKQGGKEAKPIKAAIDLFLENNELISQKSRIGYLVDNVFVPGKVPHQFFCAMAVYEDVLQHTCQRKGVNLYKPKFDDPMDRTTRNDPLFVTEGLIKELVKRAPEINPEVIKSIAYDNLPPFRGTALKTFHYHDSVLMNFVAWKSLVLEERLPLAKSVVYEMKLMYGDEWKKSVPEFSLVHARGWPLAGHIQHKLIKEYMNFVNKDSTGVTDFDTILEKLMPSGWYFPAKHMEYVNLLFRAVRHCDDYVVRELDFESFLLNREYVLPQSRACSSGKVRNLDWYLTSTRALPRSTSGSTSTSR